jgi:hypothetical protein
VALPDSGAAPRRFWPTHLLLLVALLCTVAAQARTLAFFFFQDDYVAFGEIVTNGQRDYVWNLLALQDLTPNWRVFTGMTYLASYELFGMAAWPTRAVMIALHLAVVALLYRAVWRTTASAWAAFVSAMVLGISPAYAGTFGQLGSVTYTWAAFFLALTLNAVMEAALSDGRRSNAWLAAAALSYACTIASNESMAIMFPVFILALFLFDRESAFKRRVIRTAARSTPFAAIGLAAAISFTACDCTAANDTFGLDNAHRTFLIYSGRLLYPIGLEPPQYIDPPHLLAGIALLGATAVVLVAGPAIARVGAVWMVLAIVPHALIETHTAHRFLYLATAGFALMAGGAVAWLQQVHGARGQPLIPTRDPSVSSALVAAGILFALIVPWYAWQTHLQNEPYRNATADWRLLHDEAERVFPNVPPGETVEIIGGPLTHPLDNFFVMPALGATIWGRGVRLQTIAEGDAYADAVRDGDNPFAAEFDGRDLRPITDP